MGLIDLRSNLSWYGDTPPQVNNLRDENATGFTTGNNQVGGQSEFQGIVGQAGGIGLSYIHTGAQGLGNLNETNFFLNGDHRGFRAVRQPGDQSDYTGVNSITLRYTHTGNQGLGDLAIANSFGNDDAIGFSTLSRPLQDTEFQGVDSAQSLYIHSGVQGLGNIASVNYFQNLNAIGFTNNRQQQADSEFTGVDTVQRSYTYTGTRGLGDLSRNLRPLDGLGNPERDTFVRGAVGNYTTRYSQTGGPTAQLGVISANVKGFAFQGVSELSPLQKTALDAFPINSVTFSQQGVSSRSAQLGSGTRFPIGPAGQIHEFDIERTGFSGANRYGDVYGPKSNSGLADTYTITSPIDDMYNKFKVREEAYNPFSFRSTRHPLILRGIQRDDSSDPERYGIGPDFGAGPRSGFITTFNRAAEDRARLAKYLISPEGLGYNLKQFGLQAMNPNVEDVGGGTGKGPRLTQIYDPFSVLQNVANLRTLSDRRKDRHGAPLGAFPNRGKYEQVHKDRRYLPLFNETDNNRLSRLRIEYGLSPLNSLRPDSGEVLAGRTSARPGDFERQLAGFAGRGQISNTLSGQGGPKSLLGIGRTRITRSEATDTIYLTGNDAIHGFITPSRALGNSKAIDIKNRLNYMSEPYVESGKSRSDMDDGAGIKLAAVTNPSDVMPLFGRRLDGRFGVPSSAVRIYHDSLKKSLDRNVLWLDNTGVNTSLTNDENLRGGGPASSRETIDGSSELLKSDIAVKSNWVAMSYDKLRDAAKLRDTNPNKLLNFQLMSRGVSADDADYDIGIILGEQLLRHTMYGKGKNENVDTPTGANQYKDLIKFKIGGIHFDAYITSISDSFAPGLATSNDTGVLLPRYRAESFEREISIEFKMLATNPEHLALKWQKLRRLVSIAQPVTGNAAVTSLTVGDIYRQLPVVCTGVETGWDEETTWEIHPGLQCPMLTNCSANFKVLSAGITYFNDGGKADGDTPADGLNSWNEARNKHIS